MKVTSAFRIATAAMLAAILGACGSAPQVAPAPAVPVTQSVAQADQRLAAVARERAAIEARYAEREHACYQRFLVNRCLSAAKDRRHVALAAQRAIEIEAARYKRQAAVDARDRDIATAENELKAEEARLSAEPPAPPPPRQVSQTPPPRPDPVASRIARHNEKLKQAEAREKADAGKRASRAAAFERRKRQSEERQKDVAKRLAEKAAKAAKEKPQPAQ
jgi:colicin import membrane protein